MEWNTIIKLLLIILFSVHIWYNFSESFTNMPINWKDPSIDYEANETKAKNSEESIYYAGKYDIQYHEPTSLIEKKNKDYYIYDYIKVSNKKEDKQVKRLRLQGKILYKDPVEYKYGITPYVPSYSDAILLSSSRKPSYQ